jgi:hypothetical protein
MMLYLKTSEGEKLCVRSDGLFCKGGYEAFYGGGRRCCCVS